MLKRLLSFVIVIAILIVVFFVLLNIQSSKINDNSFGEKDFVVEPGQGVRVIGTNLYQEGFIRSSFWFNAYVFVKGYRNDFFDGTFTLKTNLSLKDVVKKLREQQQVGETQIKILEGWNIQEIDDYLVENKVLEKNEFIEYCESIKGNKLLQLSVENDWPLLREKPDMENLEGFLYPDTYRIYKHATAADIVKKMIDNFHFKFDQELREVVKVQKRNVYDILKLASIVEKEMHGYENRQNVADVFLKRLEVGMALQSDATVNYITKKGTVRPSREDTQIDSPYNSYKYPGLPPTPICSPSIEALRAVIYHTKNPYWYFLTTPAGEIIYSKNYDEHVNNIYKYLN